METRNITTTNIGIVPVDAGTDQYLLLRDHDDDLLPGEAFDWLMPKVHRDTSMPGGYYCFNVRCYPAGRPNEVIAVVEHRYDI